MPSIQDVSKTDIIDGCFFNDIVLVSNGRKRTIKDRNPAPGKNNPTLISFIHFRPL